MISKEEYESKKDFVECYLQPLLARIDPTILEAEYRADESGMEFVQVKRLCFASNMVNVSKINVTADSFTAMVKDCIRAVE